MIPRASVSPMVWVVAGALFAAISAWSSGRPALELAILLVGAPIIEEWAYREVLWQRLPSPPAMRAALSTAAFVGVHWGVAMIEGVSIPPHLVAGWTFTSLMCCALRWKLGLLAAVLAHMAANWLTVLIPVGLLE